MFHNFSSRLAVEEGEGALRAEQTRVQELQQQLEHERDLSLRREREEEQRREVNMDLKTCVLNKIKNKHRKLLHLMFYYMVLFLFFIH